MQVCTLNSHLADPYIQTYLQYTYYREKSHWINLCELRFDQKVKSLPNYMLIAV